MNSHSQHPPAGTRPSGRSSPLRPPLERVSDPAVSVIAVLLEGATDEVTQKATRQLGPQVPAASIVASVAWIRDAVGRVLYDEARPDLPDDVRLTRELASRFALSLLGLLGTDPRTDKADAIGLVRALERVRQSLEPTQPQGFDSAFGSHDGALLVTEMAHDMRSPLTSIRCLAEVLERGQSGPVTDLQRKQLRLIYGAALGLGTMASDVVEMARRGEELVDTECSPFSVAEVMSGVADLVRPLADEKGIALVVQRLATDVRCGTPIALSRVLLNLTTNALKFTDSGRVEIQVRATGVSTVEFAVADTGPGIPPEALPDLFKPIRRAAGRSSRGGFLFSGTGLGLALCRKLVAAMGGELQLETAVGEGTRFKFELEVPTTSRL
ncbi:MAG TPA: HAMP domain-containing sensor histidine kinase [Gemmatimonadaceae bacterium]|nr:HAMP domain-containing sensor histidine kinase [Gemmatimonadaceae bacterium]